MEKFNLIQVHKALEHEAILPYHSRLSRPIVADVVRSTLDGIREEIKEDSKNFSEDEIIQKCVFALKYENNKITKNVINATGTILHTNLGRSPLNEKIWGEVKKLNTKTTNLEYDINSKKRGKRGAYIATLLSKLTGSESSVVVNNNASSVFLILRALAYGKDVIVSRGEQVQIGGGFRIPDILREAGCNLVEVGTTNITTIKDYTNAITDNTALILKVHTSNFKIRGFVGSPSFKELREKIPEHIAIVYDEGAGIIDNDLNEEEHIKQALKNGADLVCFSGDKIFGSVQAGIITGKATLVKKISSHQLMRAFRCGKTVLSFLERHIIAKLNENDCGVGYAMRMIHTEKKDILKKCEYIVSGIDSNNIEIIDEEIEIGGGTMPDTYYKTYTLSIKNVDVKKIIYSLHNAPVPIIAKVKNECILIYPITIDDEDLEYVKNTIKKILTKSFTSVSDCKSAIHPQGHIV